ACGPLGRTNSPGCVCPSPCAAAADDATATPAPARAVPTTPPNSPATWPPPREPTHHRGHDRRPGRRPRPYVRRPPVQPAPARGRARTRTPLLLPRLPAPRQTLTPPPPCRYARDPRAHPHPRACPAGARDPRRGSPAPEHHATTVAPNTSRRSR